MFENKNKNKYIFMKNGYKYSKKDTSFVIWGQITCIEPNFEKIRTKMLLKN